MGTTEWCVVVVAGDLSNQQVEGSSVLDRYIGTRTHYDFKREIRCRTKMQ